MNERCCGGKHTSCCMTARTPGTAPDGSDASRPYDSNASEPFKMPTGLGPITPAPKTGMPPAEMKRLMHGFFKRLMEKCERKNKAYAETDATADALANFRQAAEDFGISMPTYAMILQGKHYRAWKAYVRTGEAPDKPFRILGDIIVYAFLMYVIGCDQAAWSHEDVMADDD